MSTGIQLRDTDDRDRNSLADSNTLFHPSSLSSTTERRMATTAPILSRTTALLFGTSSRSRSRSRSPDSRDDFAKSSRQYQHIHRSTMDTSSYSDNIHHCHHSSSMYIDRLRAYFFGFMYEEMELEDSIDHYRNNLSNSNHLNYSTSTITTNTTRQYSWTNNRSFLSLTMPLSISLALQAMATSMVYTIISSIGHEIIATTTTNNTVTVVSSSLLLSEVAIQLQTQNFVQQIVSISILGIAVGKFCNGPVVDIYGARRTSVLYAFIMCTTLFVLGSISTTTTSIASYSIFGMIFIMEFVSSVQWPCTIVILATHHRNGGTTNGNDGMNDDTTPAINSNGSWYESGVFITSLSSRIGSMSGILFSSYLIRYYTVHWRTIVYIAAYITAIASSVIYLYVRDSEQKQNEPQNPIDPALYVKWFPEQSLRNKRWSTNRLLRLLMFIIQTNVVPSVRHIFSSGTFWIVTMSHTGTSMVRTSQRLLGSYFFITGDGTVSYEQAVSYSIWYSTGTVLGLFIAGTIFTKGCRNDRQRKYMILRLYIISILSCYILSITAIPAVRNTIQAPELIRLIQIMAVTTIGFGVAVQLYHIPSLVGATFGCDKGLFVSYNDGVAYLFVAVAWRYVGHAMLLQNYNELNYYDGGHGGGGGGWAYGWAAVALLLIVSAFLMVEFMEHYFCRPKYGGGGSYETIIFA